MTTARRKRSTKARPVSEANASDTGRARRRRGERTPEEPRGSEGVGRTVTRGTTRAKVSSQGRASRRKPSQVAGGPDRPVGEVISNTYEVEPQAKKSAKGPGGRRSKSSSASPVGPAKSVKPVNLAKPAKQPRSKKPAKPKKAKRRASRSVAATRARQRRAEARGIADQLRFERAEALARKRRAERTQQALDRSEIPRRWDRMSEAMEWLDDIRNRMASVFPCSLQIADPVTGDAPRPPEEEDTEEAMLAERQRENVRTPWLVVGRFDAMAPIGYEELGEGFLRVEHDLVIEAEINASRLSQIRIVYADPRARRGEGDSIVSERGGWAFVVSRVRQDLLGVVPDDTDALSQRYEETKVPTFYIYFSDEIRGTKSAWSEWGLA